VLSGARPNLNTRESQNLEEFITEFQDVFTTKSDDCGRTDRVYHHVDTGDAHLIQQPPRKLPLARQAEVSEILKHMKERGIIEESNSPWSSPIMIIATKKGDQES
jgi:hypothetical protein